MSEDTALRGRLSREEILERLRKVAQFAFGMEEHYVRKGDEPRWTSYYYMREQVENVLRDAEPVPGERSASK